MPVSVAVAPAPEPDAPMSVALDSLAPLIASLRRIKAKQERLKKEREDHEAKVKALLGDAEIGTIAGHPVVSYKTAYRIGVSQKQLKAEYPEIAEKCADITEVRTFRLLDE